MDRGWIIRECPGSIHPCQCSTVASGAVLSSQGKAQKISCNQGGDGEERIFTSILLLLQNTQNETLPHEADHLHNHIIKMVFHMDWSVSRLRCQYNAPTVNNRI